MPVPKLTQAQIRQRNQLEALGVLPYQGLSAAQIAAKLAVANLDYTNPNRDRHVDTDPGANPGVSVPPPPAVTAPPVVTPPVTTPPPSGGGGGGGETTPPPASTPITLDSVAGYKGAMEALFSFLSPEDKRTVSAVYGIPYDPGSDVIPAEITGSIRNSYMNQGRAQSAISALENMNAETKGKMGAGYTFLTNALGLLKTFGATQGAGISRENYTQFDFALNELLTEARKNKEMAPYLDIAEMVNRPGFSAGQIVPFNRVNENEVNFGVRNRKLFT